MDLDPKLLAGFEPHAAGVGLADQQVAVAMHAGAEFSLTPLAATAAAGMAGDLVALGFYQGPVEAFLEHPAARTDIAAGPGDLILGAIAQRSRLIEQGLALQHRHRGDGFLFDEHRMRWWNLARLCRSILISRKGRSRGKGSDRQQKVQIRQPFEACS